MVQRGLDQRQEVDPTLLLRDTRTFGQRVSDFYHNPSNVAVLLAGCGMAIFVMPALADVIFIIGVVSFLVGYTRRLILPFRMPKRAGLLDYNDLIPGTNKPNVSHGICFFGNDSKTNEELWFTNEDMRTHVLIFGSTGSGKTEALISLAYNSLVQGSGFIYVDGKGDNSLFAKIFSMTRAMGREDDLLLVNFMTGAKDIIGPQERRLSNTLNPFATGSSSMLSQLVISLMDSGSQSPDGDMWKGRAISFVEALMKILVKMRDDGHILLDANTVRNYFHLDRIENMVMDKVFIRDDKEPVSLEGLPEVILEPISNYLFNLPGYNKAKKSQQVSQVWEQHGFITMQLTRVFTSLADTYGHIIRTKLAEVDFHDVVLNRRILVVLLPALEKSSDELANLGKIIIASLKAMMASGLGENVEGEYHELVQRKPTNAPTPYMCILDEYGYYAVPGFAIVPAQARSLGFCTVFAGQDLPAFQKASKEEAASIGANTNIKICMKLEDPIETWEFFSKTASEAYVTKVDAFSTKSESIMNSYMDTRSASFEKRARVDLLDLKDQREGEAHIFFKSRIVRARLFYADPPPAKTMRLNQFLKVDIPPSNMLIEMNNRLVKFREVANAEDFFLLPPPDSQDVDAITEALNGADHEDPIERGVAALLAFHSRSEPEATAVEEDYIEEEAVHEMSIFSSIRLSDELSSSLLIDNVAQFGQPLLNPHAMISQMHIIERVDGKADELARTVASEVVKDMRSATLYPPVITHEINGAELAESTYELIRYIDAERELAILRAEAGDDTEDDST